MWSRLAVIVALACVGLAASGCSTTSDVVESLQSTVQDFNPFGTSKKPLPGQRKAVFPEGVPGVEQGIPAHLMQGQQQIPDQNAPAVIAAPTESPAAEPQRAKPRPTRTARPRPAPPPDDAEAAAAPPPRRPAQARRQPPATAPEAAWPAPAQQQPAATQWPAPPASQPAATVWPDPPKAGTFTR